MMKCCATCLHLHRKCDGECGKCGHTVEERTSNARPYEVLLEQIRFGSVECKCMVCHDADSGRYKYYEENKEITAMLGESDEEDL